MALIINVMLYRAYIQLQNIMLLLVQSVDVLSMSGIVWLKLIFNFTNHNYVVTSMHFEFVLFYAAISLATTTLSS